MLRSPSVPDQERWDRVLSLYGRMEPELRNEFEEKFKGFGTLQTAPLHYTIWLAAIIPLSLFIYGTMRRIGDNKENDKYRKKKEKWIFN